MALVSTPMEPGNGDGPYRAPRGVVEPFAPSLRFVSHVGGVFAALASLYALVSVWSLFSAPPCRHEAPLGGQALLLLVLVATMGTSGLMGSRRVMAVVRNRVRVRSWIGETAWTAVAAAPVLLASFCMTATAFVFDMKYLFLRCLDLGDVFSFH